MRVNLLALLVLSVLFIAVTGEEITELYTLDEGKAAIEPEYEVTVVYLYTSPEDDAIHSKFKELSKKIEGFALFYSVNCNDLTDFLYCKGAEDKPLVLLSRPPEYRVNPYTKKPMEAMHALLKKEQLVGATVDDLTKMVLNMLPNYVRTFEADTITHFQVIRYLNKVLLFTAKDQPPSLFKALATHYKDRILFGLITQNEKEIAQEYKVHKFPQIVIEESIDHKTGELFSPPKLHYYDGDSKITKIGDYIEKFATDRRLNESEITQIYRRAIEEEKVKIPTLVAINPSNASEIFNIEDPIIVYVSRSQVIPDYMKDFTINLKRMIPSYFFHLKDDMKKADIIALLHEDASEHFIFYPYGTKNKKESSVLVKATDHTLKDLDSYIVDKSTIMIESTFDNAARDILISQRKILAMYLTNEEKSDIAYKLITSHEELKRDIVFATFVKPPENFLASFGIKAKDLPRVAGLIPGELVSDRPQWPAFIYPGTEFTYDNFKEFFKVLIAQTQNKTEGPTVTKRKGPLMVVELNSTKDLKEYCLSRSPLCFIALLNAGYEETKLEQQLKMLQTIREKKANSPMEMMWINVSCHKEVLKSFGLEEMAVPTLTIYAPKKKVMGNMIGKFDSESVLDYVEGVFIGKTIGLRKFEKELEIVKTDCSAIVSSEGESLNEEERKILNDILAEEERKRKEMKKERKKKDDL